MKRSLLLCCIILIVLLILSGCIILTGDDIFTEFHLHFDGWNEYQHYDIVPYGDTWRLTYEEWSGGPSDDNSVCADCLVDDTRLQAVSAVLAKYHAGNWNSYDRTNEDLYDGTGFSLNVTYPKFTIQAKGYGYSPEGLNDAAKEIRDIFAQFSGKIEF